MNRPRAVSGTALFLTELLLAVLVFAAAAAICIQIFVFSEAVAADSGILTQAVAAVESGAECFKAAGGDLAETGALLAAAYAADAMRIRPDGNAIDLFLNGGWKATDAADAAYVVTITRPAPDETGCINGQAVARDGSGAELYAVPVAVIEAAQ